MAHQITPSWPAAATAPARGSPAGRRSGRQSPHAPSRRLSLAILAAVLYTAASTAAVSLLPLSSAVAQALAVSSLAVNAAAAALPIALLLGDPEVDRGVRRSWGMLAVATASLAAALLVELQPLPGAAVMSAPLNLAFHPLLFVAVALLPCGLRTVIERMRVLLDVFITAGSATALTVALLPASYHALTVGTTTLAPLVPIIADSILVAAVAMLWLRGMVTQWSDPLAPVGAACLLHLVVQLIAGAPQAAAIAPLVQGLVVVPLSLLGLAAVRHRRHLTTVGVTCGTPRRLSMVPTLAAAALLFAILCAAAFGLQVGSGVLITATIVGLGALLRQVIGIRDEIGAREQNVLEQADRRLAALVRQGSDMLTILDADTEVRYASPSHLQIMGIPPEMLVGRRMSSEIHRDDLPAAEIGFARLLSGESMRESLIVRLRDATGAWRWVEAVGTNLFNEPTVAGLVLNSRDITDRKLLEAQLIEQALRDPLTGLGNRRLFSDRVSHALERRVRRSSQVALLLLDLDHFKFINDTLGHAKGDALLMAVSERLQCVLRTGDTVARLGGDEFAVLLEDLVQEDEADATAVRIQQALDRPFRLDEREVFVRASIGIAWATDGQDVDALLTDADVAMYGAKNSGRGRVERYSSEMRASVAERLDLEADLRFALQRDELDLVYQPVVDLQSGRISGAEALIRWTHPEHGMILPGRFIPVAEESELIIEIGRFVIRRATFDAARFRKVCRASSRLRVAVNLSTRHLLSPELVHDMRDAMESAGIGGAAMAVELTESVLASNEPVVAGRLQGLRDLGVRIALDDFGTGYSSLAYLRRFPIDVLKVDKSFVSYGQQDVANDGVTKAIVSIGQSLRMRTVAEGVETQEQLERLREIGCSFGQGYLFSRPLSREDFETLLLAWDPDAFADPSRLRAPARASA